MNGNYASLDPPGMEIPFIFYLFHSDGFPSHSSLTDSVMTSLVLKITTFALMWVELEDRSQAFVQFLDNVTKDDFDQSLDCDLLFYKCQH